jgi:predicted metal-dependent phosphoesterase TrpH
LGLSPVFLTDHDTIDGALKLRAAAVRVVVGEEIATTEGELIGLFLTERVPAGLSSGEAVFRIKEQGGLVYLEHPYDSVRRHLTEEAIEKLADKIDIVEVFNGRSDEAANRRAKDLCETLGAASGAGSDAHTLGEIGSVYVEMEDFKGASDFLSKLRSSRIVTGRSRLRRAAEAILGSKRYGA